MQSRARFAIATGSHALIHPIVSLRRSRLGQWFRFERTPKSTFRNSQRSTAPRRRNKPFLPESSLASRWGRGWLSRRSTPFSNATQTPWLRPSSPSACSPRSPGTRPRRVLRAAERPELRGRTAQGRPPLRRAARPRGGGLTGGQKPQCAARRALLLGPGGPLLQQQLRRALRRRRRRRRSNPLAAAMAASPANALPFLEWRRRRTTLTMGPILTRT